MSYKILEAHVVFENDQLKEVAVLWDDKGAVRATYSNSTPKMGYDFLLPRDEVSPKLLQRVAGQGSYVDEQRKKKYFPGKRNWSR